MAGAHFCGVKTPPLCTMYCSYISLKWLPSRAKPSKKNCMDSQRHACQELTTACIKMPCQTNAKNVPGCNEPLWQHLMPHLQRNMQTWTGNNVDLTPHPSLFITAHFAIPSDIIHLIC